MTDQYLGPLVSGDEITSELGRRRRKDVYKTVSGSSKRLIAKKADLEEADGWQMVRKNAKSTRMAKVKAADEQLEDEVWSILAQMGFKEMSKGRQFTIAVEDGLPPRQIDVFDLRGLEQALVEIGEDDGQTLLTSLLTRSDAPSLAHFVRSLVGMDRAAAQEAFSEFLSNRSLTTPQIRFIEMVIDQLTARGVMEPSALYEAPFNSMHASGPEALFAGQGNVIEGIFEKLEALRSELMADVG